VNFVSLVRMFPSMRSKDICKIDTNAQNVAPKRAGIGVDQDRHFGKKRREMGRFLALCRVPRDTRIGGKRKIQRCGGLSLSGHISGDFWRLVRPGEEIEGRVKVGFFSFECCGQATCHQQETVCSGVAWLKKGAIASGLSKQFGLFGTNPQAR